MVAEGCITCQLGVFIIFIGMFWVYWGIPIPNYWGYNRCSGKKIHSKIHQPEMLGRTIIPVTLRWSRSSSWNIFLKSQLCASSNEKERECQWELWSPNLPGHFSLVKIGYNILVGGIPTPLKNMSSSVGMMTFPIYMENHKIPWFQTTNPVLVQLWSWLWLYTIYHQSDISWISHVRIWNSS